MSGWLCEWCGAAEGQGCTSNCRCPGCKRFEHYDGYEAADEPEEED